MWSHLLPRLDGLGPGDSEGVRREPALRSAAVPDPAVTDEGGGAHQLGPAPAPVLVDPTLQYSSDY